VFILTSSWQNARSGHWKVAIKEVPVQQLPQMHSLLCDPALQTQHLTISSGDNANTHTHQIQQHKHNENIPKPYNSQNAKITPPTAYTYFLQPSTLTETHFPTTKSSLCFLSIAITKASIRRNPITKELQLLAQYPTLTSIQSTIQYRQKPQQPRPFSTV
jgi:hypothetical protein